MTEATLLLRQVHPSFIQAGRVTSQAFRPTPKDELLLSVYDGDQISAEESWRHFTNQEHCRSAGVLAVTVGECTIEALPTRLAQELFPQHAVIDFAGLSYNQIEKNGKKLKARAEVRGWLYEQPDDQNESL
jgi:hypothetical protein